jgi:Tol biopolymer transport system component
MKTFFGNAKSRRIQFGVVIIVLVALTAGIAVSTRKRVYEFQCTPEQIAEITALSKELDGVIVFQRERKDRPPRICKTEIGETTATVLTKNGYYPRWSPDGRRIAFLRDNKVMIMTSSGRWQRRLAEVKDPWALCYHTNGKEILFTDGDSIKSVTIDTREVRTVVSGQNYRVLDVSEDGTRLATSIKGHKMLLYDFAVSEAPVIKRGCSISLSPDANFFVRNRGDHSQVVIWDWRTKELVKTITAPRGTTIDNGFWSNHQDWLVSRTEARDNENVIVYYIPDGSRTCVTFCGDSNRPDLFVRLEGN